MTGSWRLIGGTLVAVVALIAVAITANAQGPAATDLMAEANARYDREEYSEAIQLYESLVEDGYHDVALFYNLGNAHLGDGDLGRAVLGYLRARELSPRDPDVRTNLELARDLTVDRIVTERGSILESVSYFGLQWLNRGMMGVVALGMWAVCGIAIGGLLVWRAFPLRAVLRVFAGPRSSCHACVIADVPQHAVRKSVRQHGRRGRRCRGGRERPRMAVLGEVHHPQRSPGPHERFPSWLG